MAYDSEARTVTCTRCDKINHIIIAYAGDERANESKRVQCFACNGPLMGEKCIAILSGATIEEARTRLQRFRNGGK